MLLAEVTESLTVSISRLTKLAADAANAAKVITEAITSFLIYFLKKLFYNKSKM